VYERVGQTTRRIARPSTVSPHAPPDGALTLSIIRQGS
jgi:hypothetical protein